MSPKGEHKVTEIGKPSYPVCQFDEISVMDQCPKSVVAPRAGFEPATNRLTAGCSTAELPGKSLLA
jgi:hypothetical protein